MAAVFDDSLEQTANVMILGDSFVSRLEADLHHGPHVYPQDIPLHVFARDALKCPREINHVYFHGVGGAGCTPSASNPFKLPGPLLLRANPKLAIIEIGGNDVDSPARADDIAINKVDLAYNLIQLYDVRVVALTTIIPRDSCRNISEREFREKALLVNMMTNQLTEEHPNVIFFKYRSFWTDEVGKRVSTVGWSTDGVHPNTEVGMRKYKKNITSCLHEVVKSYRKLD